MGTTSAADSTNVTGPSLEELFDDQGSIWVCTGLGMRTTHRQRWQAQLRWVAMARAAGYSGSPPAIQ